MPSDSTDGRMYSRRNLLKSTGSVGVISVAGCTGETDDDDGVPADGNGDDSDAGSDDDVDFPERNIQHIVPYSTGGGFDTYSRLLAPYIAEHLPNDVDVQVQNVTGAGGQVGTESVYDAEPDGYTTGIINFVSMSQAQVLEDVNFDLTELTWYPSVATTIQSVVVSEQTDITTFEEYAEAMRNNELSIGTSGPTSQGTMNLLVLGALSGLWEPENVLQNQVAYPGTGDIITAMAQGDIQTSSRDYASWEPGIRSDDVRTLIILWTEDESPDPDLVPDVETLSTLDIENGEQIEDSVTSHRPFAGPPGVPDERRDIMRQAITEAIQDDRFLDEADEAGRPVDYISGEDISDRMESAIQTWEEERDLLEMALEHE